MLGIWAVFRAFWLSFVAIGRRKIFIYFSLPDWTSTVIITIIVLLGGRCR